jgi:hypothetical protein
VCRHFEGYDVRTHRVVGDVVGCETALFAASVLAWLSLGLQSSDKHLRQMRKYNIDGLGHMYCMFNLSSFEIYMSFFDKYAFSFFGTNIVPS